MSVCQLALNRLQSPSAPIMAEFHSSNKYKKKKSKDGKDSDSKKKKRSKPLPVALESMESEEFTKLMRSLHDQS